MAIAFQHSRDFNPAIQDIGCEYLCCMAMGSHFTRTSIEAQTINDVWDLLVADDLADPVMGLHTSLSYYRAFDLLFDRIGWFSYSGDQVGCIGDGRVIYWEWVKQKYFNYVIRRMVTANGSRHSVLLNQDFIEIYDPAPEYPGGQTSGIYLFQVSTTNLHPMKGI